MSRGAPRRPTRRLGARVFEQGVKVYMLSKEFCDDNFCFCKHFRFIWLHSLFSFQTDIVRDEICDLDKWNDDNGFGV